MATGVLLVFGRLLVPFALGCLVWDLVKGSVPMGDADGPRGKDGGEKQSPLERRWEEALGIKREEKVPGLGNLGERLGERNEEKKGKPGRRDKTISLYQMDDEQWDWEVQDGETAEGGW